MPTTGRCPWEPAAAHRQMPMDARPRRGRAMPLSCPDALSRWPYEMAYVHVGRPRYRVRMKGDRVEAVVDTGQGVQTFEIVATRAGRRIEVVTARGVVEVREVTRTGVPVRTGRFMTSRLIALVEHPAADDRGRVEESTRHRLQPSTRSAQR